MPIRCPQPDTGSLRDPVNRLKTHSDILRKGGHPVALFLPSTRMTQATRTGARTDLREILVVDDQADIREALRLLLKTAGYAIQMADSPSSALAAVARRVPDLILIDMNYASDTTSGQEGLALLDRLKSLAGDVPVIAMTGWSTIELAVQAMQHGACDFVTKPWDTRNLLELFDKHLQASEPRQKTARAAELAIARRVQRKLLPPTHFAAAGLEIDCVCLPAGEVGGDLYDFFAMEGDGAAFLLGDVCGKGIGAAILVATLQAAIRSHRELAPAPRILLERVNRLFFQSTRPEHFATLFFGFYAQSEGKLRYINCGHPSPLLLRKDGSQALLEPTALILGAFEHCTFGEKEISFQPGDRLVLFSDGVSECSAAEDNENWLNERIRHLSRQPLELFASALASAAADGEQTDDITVVAIRPSETGN